MLIACLNFFNDVSALKQSVPTYYDYVDKIVAIDGAYDGFPVDKPYSTDGSIQYLESLGKVKLITTETFWEDQCIKRSEYFKHGKQGDIFFIVDADEYVENPEVLKSLGSFDVGWVAIKSPLYKGIYKEPRLFAYDKGLHYAGRHHWIYDSKGDLVASHQETGIGQISVSVPLMLDHRRNDGRTDERMKQKQQYGVVQNNKEGIKRLKKVQPKKIVFLAGRDLACVAWNLHQAIDGYTLHESAYFRNKNTEFDYPYQYPMRDKSMLRKHLRDADVVHAHLRAQVIPQAGVVKRGATKVVHHHGSLFRKLIGRHNIDDNAQSCIRLVSNLELTRYSNNLQFLPNPVPFKKYSLMTKGRVAGKKFRIAHSPTNRAFKGTELFLTAVSNLKRKGYSVEAVLIERKTHVEAMQIKATCDAVFDSFWLGLQVSGLEGACMGLPVLAGDEYVAKKYLEWLGQIPYTYVNAVTLEDTIKQLIDDPVYYEDEATRVKNYVLKYHDLSSVAKKYLEIIDAGYVPNVASKVVCKEDNDFVKLKEKVVDPSTGRLLYGRGAVVSVQDLAKLGVKDKKQVEQVFPQDDLWYVTRKRVVGPDGRLLYGRNRRMPMTEAIRLGLVKK